MSDLALRVRGIGKRYTIGGREKASETLRERLSAAAMRPFRRMAPGGLEAPTSIWALRDVSFDVKRGEVVGIIGGNGAGKSTLLKILSRITEPTEGDAEVHGRVGALLEVGTGFHRDLTGRENVYLNGAILGMRKKEIDRTFDEIVAFAEVERFIDTPVKHYSSGMYVRLGFAVAAQMQPEILIVDEVLAVGDAQFQRKCLGKLDDVARSGRTVLFVSHNMAAIQRLCTSGVLLQHGRAVYAGDVRSTVAAYLEGEARGGYVSAPSGRVQLLSVDLEDVAGRPLTAPICTEPLVCRVRWTLPQPYPDTLMGVTVLSGDGTPIFSTHTDDAPVHLPAGPGEFEARVTIPAGVLLAGEYHLSVRLWNYHDTLDAVDPAVSFSMETGPSPVYGRSERTGLVYVPCRWAVTEHAAPEPSGRVLS